MISVTELWHNGAADDNIDIFKSLIFVFISHSVIDLSVISYWGMVCVVVIVTIGTELHVLYLHLVSWILRGCYMYHVLE
jgi:hypothetical protein